LRTGEPITRRAALTLAAGTIGSGLASGGDAAAQTQAAGPLKGRLKQSVCRWCYGAMSLDALCDHAREIGLVGIDLLHEDEWETAKKHGLVCTMAYGIGSIPDGWNHVENHDRLVAEAEKMIPKVAGAGLPNIITFSGNRRGLSDAQGLENCVTGLKRIAGLAEKSRVTVCMELLNSKRDHKDYQCDHTAWGVEVCKRVGSDRIKLLYDIYHMQIMEGDVCNTIRENTAYIAHYHTGGVPGRHEIDNSQELHYDRVARAIVASGFQGYLAHEFLPLHDPMTSLRQAVQICDV
jgi:hydroxypyruvate isomerase